jgi:flavin-dependent dehydrogenase
MMSGVDYDVIIVGAGTAGCYLTKRLVKSGINVGVLEQSARTKVDSGIVSSHFFDYVPDHSLIKARIKAMDIVSPSGTKINIRSTKPFAFLLNRDKLGKKMRSSVRSKIINGRFIGCEIHKGWVDVKTMGTNSSSSAEMLRISELPTRGKLCFPEFPKGSAFRGKSSAFRGLRSESSYSCKVLVGADGTMSSVRGALGIKPPEMTWGLMDHIEGRGHVSVHFNKNYSPDGFAWHIPRNGEMGVLSSVKPMEYFSNFARSLGKQKFRAIGSPMPVGTCRSYSDRCLLVGDAAGQVKPLTGGGIVWGMKCGEIAAKAIEYAFDVNRFDAFFWKTEYEQKWQKAIGREIKSQLFLRDVYRKLSDEQISKACELIKSKMERLSDFDYDSLSELIKELPKFSLARTFAPSFLRLS